MNPEDKTPDPKEIFEENPQSEVSRLAKLNKFTKLSKAEMEILQSNIELRNASIIESTCKPLILDCDTLFNIKNLFMDAIKRGLSKFTHYTSNVKCFPTYVERMPSGCERGKYLALDVGGFFFHAVLVELLDDSEINVQSDTFSIPDEFTIGPGLQLFDHLVDCLAQFIHKHQIENEVLPLGFTFAFPVKQIGLSKGILVNWTKGYNCTGVVNRDVVALLRESIDRRNDIKVGLIVLINDTTGTLMSMAWKNTSTKIGVIIDVGTNACYIEKTKHIEVLEYPPNSPPTMIINTEWGAFGDNGCLDFVRSIFDKNIDSDSVHPHRQTFEKMVSGMYIGEIVRRVMIACINAGALLNGNFTNRIKQPKSIRTRVVIEIDTEDPDSFVVVRLLLEHLGYKEFTNQDCKHIRYICNLVMTRSAHLAAAVMACLIDRIGDPYVVVAVSGALCNKHAGYYNHLLSKVRQLVMGEHKFELIKSTDSPGQGAALVAATAYLAANKEQNAKRSRKLF